MISDRKHESRLRRSSYEEGREAKRSRTLQDAERIFLSPSIAKSSFSPFAKQVLEDLCNSLAIPVPSEKQKYIKADYEAALRDAHNARLSKVANQGTTPIAGGEKRRRQPAGTLEDADTVFSSHHLAKTALSRFSKEILEDLCKFRGVAVVGGGVNGHTRKVDYEEALRNAHRSNLVPADEVSQLFQIENHMHLPISGPFTSPPQS